MKTDEKNLESMIEFSEKDLIEARKDFRKTSLILHFGGEIVGLVYYVCLKGMVLPTFGQGKTEFDYKNILTGLVVYIIPQLPVFFLKGLSMTQEENLQLAEKFERQAEESRQKGRYFSSWSDKKMSQLHYHFANNHEIYDKLVYGYNRLKNRIFHKNLKL